MNLAIVDCDRVDPLLAERYGQYSDMFQKQLLAQDQELRISVYDALAQQLPDLQAYDGYLITGSRHNAYDDEPWILKLVDWIQQVQQQGVKLAGICFGHQVIARALGGAVSKSDKGWGLGLASNRLLVKPSWSELPAPKQLNILVSHQDQVEQLPSGAELLAESDFCPHFMFALDQQIFAIQGHPEFEHGYAEALINKRKDILSPGHYRSARASLKSPADNHLVFAWILELFRA